MGRIKEISRRSAHKRKRNPVVYLICEGTETEIRYFKRFRSRGCHIDIIPIPSQYKAADQLVRKVRATMGMNPYYPDEGDVIWCVFDRDENTDTALRGAKQMAEREGYRLAYSNPSFELWFLLHFVDQRTEIVDCQAAVRMLRQPGRLEQYEKSQDLYDLLKPMQEKAIERAKQRILALEEENAEVICRRSNPVTTVAELVEYLNSKKDAAV